jgi:hypothetical protein
MLSWDEPGKHPEPRPELVEGRVPSVLEQGVEGCDKPQCPSYGEPACFDTSFVTGLRPYSGLLSMLWWREPGEHPE